MVGVVAQRLKEIKTDIDHSQLLPSKCTSTLFSLYQMAAISLTLRAADSALFPSAMLSNLSARQKDSPQDVRIHAIHFPDPRNHSDARIGDEMRRIARTHGGKYRKIGR